MSELREAQPGACGGRRQAALRPMPSLAAWIVDAGDQDYAEVVEKAGVPVLVDLWATWCGPCRMVSPALEKLATERAGQLKLVKVDVDKRRPPRNGSRYKRCRRCSSSTAARRWPVNPGPHPLRRCGLGWIRPWPHTARGRGEHDVDRLGPGCGGDQFGDATHNRM